MEEENPWKKPLLLLSCILFVIGAAGIPLATRLYFLQGGSNVWLTTWLQTGGFPIIAIALMASYIKRRRTSTDMKPKLFLMQPWLFLHSSLLGLMYGLQSYLYVYGCSKLPVSTLTLLTSAQLVFISFFAFLLVNQKFNLYSIGAIAFLTVGGAFLALSSSSDLPEGESGQEYVLGFVSVLTMTVMIGLYVPLMESAIAKSKQVVNYTLTMEINLVLCFSATLFSTLVMLINQDFTDILKGGEVKYMIILAAIAVVNQCFVLGATGVICCASSLFYGIINAALVPVIEILGVILYNEAFQVGKIGALLFALLGLSSYFYGEIRPSKRLHPFPQIDSSPLIQNV